MRSAIRPLDRLAQVGPTRWSLDGLQQALPMEAEE